MNHNLYVGRVNSTKKRHKNTQSNNALFIVGFILVIAAALFVKSTSMTYKTKAIGFNPVVNPADFTGTTNNKYFTLTPGRMFVYEGDTAEGREHIEVEITHDSRLILGVNTTVIHDKVWLDGVVIEDTKDYLAEHSNGDVWYFGEDVDNYDGGVIISHAGSWLAGVDGAKPGFWMKANPRVGETYRQEFKEGEAEDMAKVMSLKATADVPYGTFVNCLKTRDYTLLDPSALEFKIYCPQVGSNVLEIDVTSREQVKLIEVRQDGAVVSL